MSFKSYLLKDLIEVKHGFAFPGEKFSDDLNFPTLVTPGNFRIGGGFIEAKAKTFYGDIPKDFILNAGDLIVTMTDLSKAGDCLGFSAVVPTGKIYLHNQRVGKVINKQPEILTLKYLNWFMRTSQYRSSIMASATGTTVRHTSPARILEIEISLPPLREQQVIANVLDTLDSIIASNEKLARTLENVAQIIFEAWFTDFEPVKAKMVGTEPEGLDAVTGTLFPESMEQSTLGLIPKGWKVTTLGDFADVQKKTINPQNFPDRKFLHYSLPGFDLGNEPASQLGNTIKSNKFLLNSPCVLVSKLNPKNPRNWLILNPESDSVSSTEFIPLTPKKIEELYFLNCLVRTSRFQAQLVSRVSGSTGSHQRVKPEEILNIEHISPNEILLEEFARIVSPMFQQVELSNANSKSLKLLRDSLLPRLIFGMLRIPNEMLTS